MKGPFPSPVPSPHSLCGFWQKQTQPKHFPWCLRSSERLKTYVKPSYAAGVTFISLVNVIFYLYLWRHFGLGCTGCSPAGFCRLLPPPHTDQMIWALLRCWGMNIGQHSNLGSAAVPSRAWLCLICTIPGSSQILLYAWSRCSMARLSRRGVRWFGFFFLLFSKCNGRED